MINEMSTKLHPTQVHIQTCIPSRYSCIDCFHEFIGSALVRFERSTLPEHEGARTVVLRLLKIITPVKCVIPLYDGYISCPKEGELHRRGRKVWSVNIDTGRWKGPQSIITSFQLLWNA